MSPIEKRSSTMILSRWMSLAVLGGSAMFILAACGYPMRGQAPNVLATVDLMKTDWKYAPCKQINEGNQAGFTWAADGWKKEYAETAENGWKAIDHLPTGEGPEETIHVGIRCGSLRRPIRLPTHVGEGELTG